MRRIKSIFKVSVAVSLMFFFGGCDEIHECIFNINPEIHNKRLAIGVLGERYSDVITAEVKNEVFDNDYFYDFDVYGDLPPGVFLDFERRSIEIYGTPEEVGIYRFEVELSVESYDEYGYDGSPTCEDSTVREFTIQVVE